MGKRVPALALTWAGTPEWPDDMLPNCAGSGEQNEAGGTPSCLWIAQGMKAGSEPGWVVVAARKPESRR